MQVKFTPLELRELGELDDVDMVVYEEDFDYDEASKLAIETNKQVLVLDRIFTAWRETRRPGSASRRLHLHFFASPVEVLGDAKTGVTGFRYERTEAGRRGRHPAHRRVPRGAGAGRLPCGRATSGRSSTACRSTIGAASSRTARARSSTTTTSR